MNELSRILHFLEVDDSQAALATLVKVEGSSYRRPGARLLWRQQDTRVGSISGGCLEEDLAIHCQAAVTANQSRIVVYDTIRENDLVWGVGLGCNGVVHILVEPASQAKSPLKFVNDAWARREAVCLITVFRSSESNTLGTQFALGASGQIWASNPSITHNRTFQSIAELGLKNRRSTNRTLAELPGTPEVFVEFLPPPVALLVCGAGDDAQPLVRTAATLGWEITVVDPRPAMATSARFPEANTVIATTADIAVSRLNCDAYTAAVVMTHHYIHDVPLLRALLSKNLPYLGLLGPKKRAEKILGELAADGLSITPQMHATLHAPVGLDLGAATPEAVALAILAEIQARLHGGNAQPLRERNGPIHHD